MEHGLFWFIVCSFNRYSVYYSVGSTISSSVSWLVGLDKINLKMATINIAIQYEEHWYVYS